MLFKKLVKRADKVLVTWSDNYPDISGQDLNDLVNNLELVLMKQLINYIQQGLFIFKWMIRT